MKSIVLEFVQKVVPRDFRDAVQVSTPDSPEHGDYSTNIAFAIAKEEGKSPREVAEELVKKLQEVSGSPSTRFARSGSILFHKIEVAGGGFINFWISEETLFEKLRDVTRKADVWGRGEFGKGKKVRVEYFQPNVAKIPHVGHLRSAVIGDALKRMFLSQGYKVVSDTHIGDWGTQFGILLYGWKQLSAREQEEIKKDPIRKLNELYVSESGKIDDDPELREKGKAEFAKLERGDKENRRIWKWMVRVSEIQFQEIMDRLGLLKFEEQRAESVYEDAMPGIVERALKKGIAIKKEGAVAVDLGDVELGNAVLLKSDGASTYLLRDLATLEYLGKKKLEKNLYVVDTRQSHHFHQAFEVARRMKIPGAGVAEHVEFGFMSLPEGAISTRKGNVVGLLDVLGGITARAREVIREKNPGLKNKEKIADAVGIGALKYFDLSHHRRSDIVFHREKSLSFEGNTGPYIQYTYARLQSILRRLKTQDKRLRNASFCQMDESERRLLVGMLRLPEVLEDALCGLAPNVLADYLHSLAQGANEFYHSHPVLQEGDAGKRAFRLALVSAVAITLKNGLYLLGIEAPEEM